MGYVHVPSKSQAIINLDTSVASRGAGGAGGGDVHDRQCLSVRLCHTVAGYIRFESWFNNNNLDANFRILSISDLDTSVASVFSL